MAWNYTYKLRLSLISPLSHLNETGHQFVLVVLCNYTIRLDSNGPAISSIIRVSRQTEQLNTFILQSISIIQTWSTNRHQHSKMFDLPYRGSKDTIVAINNFRPWQRRRLIISYNFKLPARGPVISRRLNRRAGKMRRMNMSLLGISGLKSWRHAHACRRRDRGMCASCQQRSCCNPHPHGASKMQGVVDMYVPRSHPMRRSLHVPVYGSRAWFVSEKWEHAKNQIWCSDVSIVNSQEKSG